MSKGLAKSSVGKKILMALSGFFLLVFLLQHFLINFLSVLNPDSFNKTSEFMGTNTFVQFFLQPILFLGVIYHFIMGIKLELENRAARPVKYVYNNPSANSTWMSRNMIITGMVILLFLILHLIDFFFPTINAHYISGEHLESYDMVVSKFSNIVFVGIYVLAFIFLSLHLLHGFQSAFQSLGLRHKKYTPFIKKLGDIYAIVIPLGYIFIAIYHYANSL